MRWLGGWVVRGLGLAVGAAAAVVSAQPVVGEPALQVNTLTLGWQFAPDVAAAPSGGFIVTWWSRPTLQDGSADGVFLRAFDATGTPHGPEVLVPENIKGSHCLPRVAIGPDGNAIVTWIASDSPWCMGPSTAQARRFDGAGHALGPAAPLPAGSRAAIGFDGTGNGFGLVCSGQALRIAALAEAGAVTDAVTVEDGASSCELAGLPGGGGVATWTDTLLPYELHLASFDADLTVGAPQLVGTGFSFFHDVAVSSTGRVMVVWSAPDGSDTFPDPPYYQSGVFGRLFDSTGTPLTGAFRVNTARAGNQILPAVASDGKGRFLVSWMNGLGPEPAPVPGRNPNGINARLFDDDGTPLGSEFAVDFDLEGFGGYSRVDGTAGGDFVVAWEGERDGDTSGGYNVFARRLAAVPCSTADACDDGDACTTDTCERGICIGRSIPGCCRADAECDDADPCTTDACTAGTCVNQDDPGCVRCEYGLLSTCDDGDPTTREWCSGGRCVWTPVQSCQNDSDCDDGDACTTDHCSLNECYSDPIFRCERCASDADCTDWLGCTENRCVDGRCEFTPIADCAYCAFPADCDSGCLLGPDACVENACVPAAGCPVMMPGDDPVGAAARFQIEVHHPESDASALVAGRPLRAKAKLVLAEDAGGRRCRAGARVGGARGRALPGESTMIEVGLGRRGARCLAQAGDLRLAALVVVKAGRRAVLRRTVELRWRAE